MYGNNGIEVPMGYLVRMQKEGSRWVNLLFFSPIEILSQWCTDLRAEGISSRYFTGQNGKNYKWRIGQGRMEVSTSIDNPSSHLCSEL